MVTPVTLSSFWSAVEYLSTPRVQCSYDRCSLFVQLRRLQGKSIMQNLAFDLKNSHALDMFKNRLQNWHYPKSVCQICSKFSFFSFFYNAITKFWRPINRYPYYCNYLKKQWMYNPLISLPKNITFLWFSIKIFHTVRFTLESLQGCLKELFLNIS